MTGHHSEFEILQSKHEGLIPYPAPGQCTRNRHDMPDDLKESVGRVVIRIVPLFYAGLFGSLIEDLPTAMVFGGMLTAAVDLTMREHSVLRSAARFVRRGWTQ